MDRHPHLDVCLDIGPRRHPRNMVASYDPFQRAVRAERLDLVTSRVIDRDTVAPRRPHRLPSRDLPEQPPSPVHILAVRLPAGVRAEGAPDPAFPIPELDDSGIFALGRMDCHDRAVRRGGLGPEPGANVLQPEGSAVVSVRVEDRHPQPGCAPGDDRVARPPLDFRQTPELAGSLTLASPGRQVGSVSVEHPQLLRPHVRHHDPSVGQLGGIGDIVEHVGLFAFQDSDGGGGLGSDAPGEPRAISWAAVLDDLDAGAVAGGDGRGGSIDGIGGTRRWCEHGQDCKNANHGGSSHFKRSEGGPEGSRTPITTMGFQTTREDHRRSHPTNWAERPRTSGRTVRSLFRRAAGRPPRSSRPLVGPRSGSRLARPG